MQQYFPVVAAYGGASFNYSIYTSVFKYSEMIRVTK